MGCFDLSLGLGGLGANIGIVEFEKELPLVDVISFFHQQSLHRGRDRGVSFKILNRLNLAIRGYNAANRASLNSGHAYFERRLMQVGIQNENDYDRERDPNPPPAWRCMRIVRRRQPFFFQVPAGITVSSNLPSEGADGIRRALLDGYLFGCG